MKERLYKTRDSATSILRKMGLKSDQYNNFISRTLHGEFVCDVIGAEKFLHPTKIPVSKKESITSLTTISSTARELILNGKNNKQVWEILKVRFKLDDSKKYYPTWYRCELRRKGMLSN